MVKVISETPQTMKASCGKCGVGIEYGKQDVHKNAFLGSYWVICPKCSKKIVIVGNRFRGLKHSRYGFVRWLKSK